MCRQIKQHINDVLIYDCSVKLKKRKEKKRKKINFGNISI